MEKIDEHKAFGGWQRRYTHASEVCNCTMTFALYLPPLADTRRVPVVYWLSGLTCTDENFVNKAGAQRIAAELGVAIVAPDTSPRGDDVADEDSYDMGKGAGFYVNATEQPWASHYQMYDYVVKELPALLADKFATTLDMAREAICGHSMGGHGALVIGLRNLDRFAAISAFSPICAPSEVPWGQKAFPRYLGENREAWLAYDATAIMENADNGSSLPPILIDQGLDDGFYEEQLHPHRLEQAADKVGAQIEVRRRDGYDHSYFFIASFMDDHLRFLGKHLGV